MTTRRLGILGGTFDPIHEGHLDVARAADAALGLTELRLVPSFTPPHRAQPLASGYHRFAMVAMSVLGQPHWLASDIELREANASYTTHTLARLRTEGLAPTEIFFILGADAFAEIESWRDYPRLLDTAHFAVVSRRGWTAGDARVRVPALASRMRAPDAASLASADTLIFLIDAPTADVASTTIRDRCAAGVPIRGMVAPAVAQHIEQHRLYMTGTAPRASDSPNREPAAGRLHGQD